MKITETKNHQRTCPYCGAPIVAEICEYCGNATGLNTAEADMEYPVLDCKEASLTFWSVGFPMIFVGAFGLPGLIMLLVCIFEFSNIISFLMGTGFFLGGAITLVFVIRNLSRYLRVKTNGKIIQGTVYGYIDDNFYINGNAAQVVKILVQTANGPRFILYKLKNTVKLYGIHDKIDLMVYKNYFMICKNKETVSW